MKPSYRGLCKTEILCQPEAAYRKQKFICCRFAFEQEMIVTVHGDELGIEEGY